MKRYDIVIIGGGINGAGCAQAAAAAGYSCLVLEQYSSPAQGTSSRSSKLIHGGLRYLESAQFSLVRECLNERRRLLKNAPELVTLIPFYIPIYKTSKRSPWIIRAGLTLYWLLGGGRFKVIPKQQWNELDNISTHNLSAVFQYWDAQTDDAALTRAVLESARNFDATILMDAKFNHAQRQDIGYNINYSHNKITHECYARHVINATGPWINELLNKVSPKPTMLDVDLVAGTHLVLPGHLHKGIYYLESPTDGRAIFVAPWKNNILIGTTEMLFRGNPADITPTDSEIDYLLNIYNYYYGKNLSRTDIIQSFAGLRVLPTSTEAAFHRSRDTIIHSDNIKEASLISIYGGKLTAYRATAENVLKLINNASEKSDTTGDTRNMKITTKQ